MQQGKPGPKIPKAVPQHAHSCAMWTATLGIFPVSLNSAPPSDLEPWVLQTAAKTVNRPSERRRRSRRLLFRFPGKAPVEYQAAHRLLDSVVPPRPGIAVWTRPSPSLQGTNGPSPPEEPLKNTSKQTQQSLYVRK